MFCPQQLELTVVSSCTRSRSRVPKWVLSAMSQRTLYDTSIWKYLLLIIYSLRLHVFFVIYAQLYTSTAMENTSRGTNRSFNLSVVQFQTLIFHITMSLCFPQISFGKYWHLSAIPLKEVLLSQLCFSQLCWKMKEQVTNRTCIYGDNIPLP